MLVLSRKSGEKLVIGDAVVTILGGGTVRLGVEAPKSVKVLRSELIEQREPAGEQAIHRDP